MLIAEIHRYLICVQYMFPLRYFIGKNMHSIEMVKFSYQLDRPQDAQIKHYFWVYLWGCFQMRVAFKLTDRRFPSPIWVNIIQFLENPNIFSIYIKICQNKIYNINSLYRHLGSLTELNHCIPSLQMAECGPSHPL